MEEKEKILEVSHLKKYFKTGRGTLKAVDDVSFFIRKGETLGIVGESGCGKTTCGRTCIGILGRTDGHVLYKGKDVHSLRGKERKEFTKEVQIIFQDPYSSLDPKMKVGDIIAEGLKAHHMCRSREEEQARVKELLETVGLNAEHATRYVHEFSGGQRQRIGIARALAVEPDLFIAHDLAMVKHISDRVAVMYLGNIVEITQASALYANPMHPYTQALLSAIPIPDPEVEEKKQRIRLEGELPSPVDPPEGCRFINRCRFASERCRKERPELLEMEPGHLVACHYCEEMKKGTV